MPRNLKIGLIGYGLAGKVFHAPLIAHSGRTELVAIVTSRIAEAQSRWPEVRILSTPQELLALDEIELAVIATPNDTHVTLACEAIAAGKHVVVDKPFALSSTDARMLLERATAGGLLAIPFHNRRWDGDFLTVRDLLAEGRLGRLVQFESHFDRFAPETRKRWKEDEQRGGGFLFDQGPHLTDQALLLFGPPRTVFAIVEKQREGATSDDYVRMELGYPGLLVVLQSTALAAIPGPRFHLNGTRGSYLIHGVDSQEALLRRGMIPGEPGWAQNSPGQIRYLAGDQVIDRELPTRNGCYQEFYRLVAAAVLERGPLPVAPQDAVTSMRVLEAARESARSACVVPFPLPAGF